MRVDATELRLELLRRLRSVVPFEAGFFATVDPATVLFTSVVSEEPCTSVSPLYLANEIAGSDVNHFVDFAAAADPVATLDRATAGDRASSARYRDIMAPLALGDELRIALRSRGQCWGAMCLHREAGPYGFDDHDLAMMRRLAPHVAEGLRHSVLFQPSTAGGSSRSGPGVIVVGDDLSVESMNPAAELWLSEIADADWPRASELPMAIAAAAGRLSQLDDPDRGVLPPPEVRLRTATGTWLTVTASRLQGPNGRRTAIIIEPAAPAAITSLILDGHGLTPAQARVTALVLRGRSSREIVNELGISSHTLQDHLKAVFDKLGVNSRRELVAALLAPPSP